MNIVHYTDDMEPITVIDLPDWGVKMLKHGQFFRVAVPPAVPSVQSHFEPVQDFEPIRTATIWAEMVRRNDQVHWLFFTHDDVNALMLKSEQLPGQRKEFQDEFKRGFAHGVLRVIGF